MISVPSYLIPGTYLENVRFVAGETDLSGVGAIELLFFEWDQETRELFASERDAIARHGDRFVFSAHLPDRLSAEHLDLLQLCEGIVSRYVVHPPTSHGNLSEFARLMNDLINRYGPCFDLENTTNGIRVEEALELVPELRLCCDTGHLLLGGEDPSRFMERNGERVRSVHLHGIKEGRDHAGFLRDEEWVVRMTPYLKRPDLILHVEIFSYERLRPVLPEVHALLESLQKRRTIRG